MRCRQVGGHARSPCLGIGYRHVGAAHLAAVHLRDRRLCAPAAWQFGAIRVLIGTAHSRAGRDAAVGELGDDATLAALVEILDRIPQRLRRTLTWDQGREMARHADLA